MIKKIITAALLSFLPLVFCFGQGEWEKGYVILLNGDTIHGFIENEGTMSNTRECLFRTDRNSASILYKPGRIKGYIYTGGPYYASCQVKFDKSNLHENKVEEDTLFLECLVKGKINLYHIMGEPTRYFIEKDNQFNELINSEKITYTNGKTYNSEKKEYIGILNFLLQEAHIQNEIQKCKLEQDDLIALLKNYHKKVCPGDLLLVFSFSQGAWKTGYVILPDGDTIHGFVENKGILLNTQQCCFRADMSSPAVIYKPSRIKAYFYYGGPYFASYPVKFNKSNFHGIKVVEDTLFLECLVKGKINLYQILTVPSRYFIEKDNQFYELLNSEKIIYDNGKSYNSEKKEYIGILDFLLQDAHFPNEIQKCKFDQDAFIALVKNYHKKVYPGEECIVFGNR